MNSAPLSVDAPHRERERRPQVVQGCEHPLLGLVAPRLGFGTTGMSTRRQFPACQTSHGLKPPRPHSRIEPAASTSVGGGPWWNSWRTWPTTAPDAGPIAVVAESPHDRLWCFATTAANGFSAGSWGSRCRVSAESTAWRALLQAPCRTAALSGPG